MTPAFYDVVYRGKILPGFDIDDVKSKLMDLFSISEEKAMKIINSNGVALKKSTDEVSAKKYETALRRIGMEVTLTRSKKEPGSGETPRIPLGEGTAKKENKVPFEFSGSGSEYFKIWLVNIILSVITIGIYSAWAKVRSTLPTP
ncbi:MAG: DUF898 family protein [Deltaproteobacteria bacterium]|nr:DUF898 family protein [Deltaproteobacteria bacterium]